MGAMVHILTLLVMKLNGDEYTFVHANEGVLGGAPHIDPHSITTYIMPY